jgi:hypothetical protein
MTRRRTTRHGLRLWHGNAGGYCYQRVQAIIIAIDQYAEKAPGNREYFLNKPHGIGDGRNDRISLTATEASASASSQLPGLDDRVLVIE